MTSEYQNQPLPRKRVFPGPAGLDASAVKKSSLDFQEDDNGGSSFFGQPWARMLENRKKNESDPKAWVNRYNIKKIKELTIAGSSQKMPVLSVIIKSLDKELFDPLCEFKDRTGTINAMIHREIAENYESLIVVGITCLLI